MRNPCYHCHKNPAARHSNFCEECLPENRPLYFPAQPEPMPLLTRMLMLTAIASVCYGLFELLK